MRVAYGEDPLDILDHKVLDNSVEGRSLVTETKLFAVFFL
jgi:hypothetical protein